MPESQIALTKTHNATQRFYNLENRNFLENANRSQRPVINFHTILLHAQFLKITAQHSQHQFSAYISAALFVLCSYREQLFGLVVVRKSYNPAQLFDFLVLASFTTSMNDLQCSDLWDFTKLSITSLTKYSIFNQPSNCIFSYFYYIYTVFL